MTYTDLNLSVRSNAKDIKNAAPRTQLYVRLLQRVHGLSAAEMKTEVHKAFPEVAHLGFTPHNSYSLQLLANTYGFDFLSIDYIDEGKLDGRRYFFRSEKNAAKFDAAKREQAKAQGVRMPRIKNDAAKASARVAKASLASRSVAGSRASAKA